MSLDRAGSGGKECQTPLRGSCRRGSDRHGLTGQSGARAEGVAAEEQMTGAYAAEENTDAVCALCQTAATCEVWYSIHYQRRIHDPHQLASGQILDLLGCQSICRSEPHSVERSYLYRPGRFYRFRNIGLADGLRSACSRALRLATVKSPPGSDHTNTDRAGAPPLDIRSPLSADSPPR
jgi:hypothetical protein